MQFAKHLRDGARRGQITDITAELARQSGFKGVVDYLVRFHYVPPRARRG